MSATETRESALPPLPAFGRDEPILPSPSFEAPASERMEDLLFKAILQSSTTESRLCELVERLVPARAAGHRPSMRFRAKSVADILAEIPPPPLVDGIIGQGGLVVLYGNYGAGKTFLSFDLALHIASHFESWQGHRLAGGPVLYVQSEGQFGSKARLRAWLDYHQYTGESEVTFLQEVVPLHQEEAFRHFLIRLDSLPARPVLIVFDTLAGHLGGGDENTSTGMGAFVSNAASLVNESGATVMIIHHTGWNGRLRGFSALPAAMDRVIKVSKKGSDRILVTNEKARDDEPFPDFTLRLREERLDETELGGKKTSLVIERDSMVRVNEKLGGRKPAQQETLPEELEPTYRALYKSAEGMTYTEWRKASDQKGSTFDRHLKRLVQSGWVQSPAESGRGGRYRAIR